MILFRDLNEAGLRVVIQNLKGEVMTTLTEKIPLPYFVVLLEALAARRAVFFAIEFGFGQSIFKGDSEILVKILNNANPSHASIGHIIKDIQSTSSLFRNHSFSYLV